MGSILSDPNGRPYAGGGPTKNDDGSPLTGQLQRIVGNGSDTTGLSAGYTGNKSQPIIGTESAPATMGNGRSAGENSGTGFAVSS